MNRRFCSSCLIARFKNIRSQIFANSFFCGGSGRMRKRVGALFPVFACRSFMRAVKSSIVASPTALLGSSLRESPLFCCSSDEESPFHTKTGLVRMSVANATPCAATPMMRMVVMVSMVMFLLFWCFILYIFLINRCVRAAKVREWAAPV